MTTDTCPRLWRGAKLIRETTFFDRDILGFWEVRGYSNTADPRTEDRFAQKAYSRFGARPSAGAATFVLQVRSGE